MGWRDYLQAEWEFDENSAGTTYADSKDGLFPLTTPLPTVTSDYSVVGKFGRAFSPSLITPVSPYVRSAVIDDDELVYNEFSIRLWIQIYRLLYGGGVMRRSTVAVGVTESYRIIIDSGMDEGNICWFRVLFQISHLTEPSSLIRSNKIYAGTWVDFYGYYGDLIWREYLVTFKKQASTPRGHIYIDGIDVTDYAYESSHDNDVAVGTDSRIQIEGDTESDIEELRLDRLQIFNKAMVPGDFLAGNELVDQSLIYPGIPQLAGF